MLVELINFLHSHLDESINYALHRVIYIESHLLEVANTARKDWKWCQAFENPNRIKLYDAVNI